MRLLALALLLAAPTLAAAQPGSATRVGLGIRLGADILQVNNNGRGLDVAPTPQFSIPIDVNGLVRVEPEIGYISISSDDGGFSQSSRQTSLGLAVSALVPSDDLTLTLGARVRYFRSAFEFSSGGDAEEFSSSALGVGPVVGGEYPFSDRFAIGAEAGVQYFTFSENDDANSDDDPSVISTTAALTARFFF